MTEEPEKTKVFTLVIFVTLYLFVKEYSLIRFGSEGLVVPSNLNVHLSV